MDAGAAVIVLAEANLAVRKTAVGVSRVLVAQRALYAARQELVEVRLARLSNLVTLYKVQGGGASLGKIGSTFANHGSTAQICG